MGSLKDRIYMYILIRTNIVIIVTLMLNVIQSKIDFQ